MIKAWHGTAFRGLLDIVKYNLYGLSFFLVALTIYFAGCNGHDPKLVNQISPNITIYFTNPPNDPPVDDSLIQKINSQTTADFLDVCFYGFDRENVIKALENAIKRGVHVRFVGDIDGSKPLSDNTGDYYLGYQRIAKALDSAFPVPGKQRMNFPADAGFSDFNIINSNAIMHNKWVLIADNSGNKSVYCGSTNCTESGFEKNNNSSLIIRHDGLFDTYRQQFEYLLGLPNSQPVNTVVNYTIDGIPIEIFFAPNKPGGRSVIEHLISLVEQSDKSINFMIFSFPQRDLIDLVLKKSKDGLLTKGIFDESQLNNSSEEYLAQRGVPCKIDGNHNQVGLHGGKLHHKVMILDENQNNAVVAVGSFNWSDNANTANDENIMFIHSKAVAQVYMNEWNARWKEGTLVQTIPNGDLSQYQSVLINEVMWMGSHANDGTNSPDDEFIELENKTNTNINLSAWAIKGASTSGKPLLLSNCILPANGLITIQSKNPQESAFESPVLNINNDISISNERLELTLEDPNCTVVDYAGNGSKGEDFAGLNGSGSNGLKKSMARLATVGDGKIPSNWFTSNTQVNIDNDYSTYTFATPCADNGEGAESFNKLDVVFSEIAWAGTDASANDEWIELYNNTGQDIALGSWEISGGISINLSGTIPAHKHFLLERTDDNSVPGKISDLIYSGALNNSGAMLVLSYNNSAIDSVGMQTGWAAGSSNPKISMERISNSSNGEAGNWKNGSGDIEGAMNSSE